MWCIRQVPIRDHPCENPGPVGICGGWDCIASCRMHHMDHPLQGLVSSEEPPSGPTMIQSVGYLYSFKGPDPFADLRSSYDSRSSAQSCSVSLECNSLSSTGSNSSIFRRLIAITPQFSVATLLRSRQSTTSMTKPLPFSSVPRRPRSQIPKPALSE